MVLPPKQTATVMGNDFGTACHTSIIWAVTFSLAG